ncbi:MAG: hypothetical protein M1822_002217 [Bathelium mastoideum]|nr:MAG: hypothetical protein M1822_002217 [Bathelium mastoideum]
MPPAVNRFGPNHLSNPFAHIAPAGQQSHGQAQTQGGLPQTAHISHHHHPHHQTPQLQQSLGGGGGGHPAFGAAHTNAVNPFGLAGGNNVGLQAGFMGSAGVGAGGGAGGGGLGGALGGGLGGGNMVGGGNMGGTGGMGLASREAQLAYQHGAHLQEQAAFNSAVTGGGQQKGASSRIREVWKSNLHAEVMLLRQLVDRYPYISLDTEFPGVVARPIGNFPTKADYHYQTVRCNADLLKIIQLGVTLWSPEGEVPPPQPIPALLSDRPGFSMDSKLCPCTWQFNFQFDKDEDMYNEESVDLLAKAGLDIGRCQDQGIDPKEFGSLLITSGLILDDSVHWISFHSGYDIAYLVKLMYCKPLPKGEEEFYRLAKTFFPNLWDAKFLQRQAQRMIQSQQQQQPGGRPSSAFSPQAASTPGATQTPLSPQAVTIINNLGGKSSLQDLADELGCHRVGVAHSAGSDAWLTGLVFWAMRAKIFDGHPPAEFANQMWGLNGVAPPASASTQAAALAAQQQHQQQQHHSGAAGHGGAVGGGGVVGGGASGMNGGAMGYHTGGTPATHRSEASGAPSTPTTNHPGVAGGAHGSTPGPQGHHGGGAGGGGGGGGGFGTMTPGGGAGVFGNFQYGK